MEVNGLYWFHKLKETGRQTCELPINERKVGVQEAEELQEEREVLNKKE